MIGPITKIVAYSFIGIVGVIGNLVLLLSISKVTYMQNATKTFIEQLAIIDIIINVVHVPSCIMNILQPNLTNNPNSVALFRCQVKPYIVESLTAALINTLVALTIDRYIAIVHPLTNITKRQHRVILTLIWSFAFIFSLPEMLTKHLNEMKCDLTWPSNFLRNLYYGFDAIENCIAPVCIIIYCYIRIWRVLKNRQLPGESIGNEKINERIERDRIKIMKMIFVITMYFVLSGVPLYIAFLTYEFNRDERNQVRNHAIHFWLDWFALTHLFMNPFLYCLMSTRIRNSFKTFLKCGISEVKRPNATMTATAKKTNF